MDSDKRKRQKAQVDEDTGPVRRRLGQKVTVFWYGSSAEIHQEAGEVCSKRLNVLHVNWRGKVNLGHVTMCSLHGKYRRLQGRGSPLILS